MKVVLTEENLVKMISEELANREDIGKQIAYALKHNKDVEKAVKDISADVVKNLFKTLWQRNNFWDSEIRR